MSKRGRHARGVILQAEDGLLWERCFLERRLLGDTEQARGLFWGSGFSEAQDRAPPPTPSSLPCRSPGGRHCWHPTACHGEVPWVSTLGAAQIQVQVAVDLAASSPQPPRAQSRQLQVPGVSAPPASGSSLPLSPEPTGSLPHRPPWVSFLQTCRLPLISLHHGGPHSSPATVAGTPGSPRLAVSCPLKTTELVCSRECNIHF